MSQPFNVEPGQLGAAGGAWDGQLPEFGATPPSVSGSWPTHDAVRGAIAATKGSTEQIKQGVGQTADNTRQAAGKYQDQEKDNAKGLSESTGIANNLIGAATNLIGELPQAFGVLTQGIGALTGLAGSGAGIIGSLTGAAVSGQHLANPDQPDQHGHNPGGWNPNNNNPESSHDYVHPNPEDAVFDGGHW